MGVESALLQLMLTPGIGDRTLTQVLERLDADGIPVDEFVRDPDLKTFSGTGIKADSSRAISSRRDEALRLWEELEQRNVQLLLRTQTGYPRRLLAALGNTAPPAIFAIGDARLLDGNGVAIVGSRKASDAGLQITSEIAAACAQHDLNVISGYANGVDLAAHEGALEFGGVTTLVLAEGILNLRWKPSIAEWADTGKIVVLSEFSPRMKWFATSAMKRNATVCGLSNSVIVIESGLTGGTFEVAKTTLGLGIPLFVVDFADPAPSAEGNRHFLKHGARPIRRSLDGSPNLEPVWESIGLEPKHVVLLQARLGLS